MKVWKKYSKYLLEGDWHIHTNYTDGNNTVYEYCEKAQKLGIPLLAFTEHVRQELSYDFNVFLNTVEKTRDEFDLIVLSGCEVKILPNGELDVEKEILKEIDYPIFAIHSFPEDIDLYIKTLKTVLRNKYINTWAHPGYFLKRHNMGLSKNNSIEIFKIMNRQDVLFEINGKYKTYSKDWIDVAKQCGVKMVNGSDAHCIEDLETCGK